MGAKPWSKLTSRRVISVNLHHKSLYINIPQLVVEALGIERGSQIHVVLDEPVGEGEIIIARFGRVGGLDGLESSVGEDALPAGTSGSR